MIHQEQDGKSTTAMGSEAGLRAYGLARFALRWWSGVAIRGQDFFEDRLSLEEQRLDAPRGNSS
jgi:hypothetical protein